MAYWMPAFADMTSRRESRGAGCARPRQSGQCSSVAGERVPDGDRAVDIQQPEPSASEEIRLAPTPLFHLTIKRRPVIYIPCRDQPNPKRARDSWKRAATSSAAEASTRPACRRSPRRLECQGLVLQLLRQQGSVRGRGVERILGRGCQLIRADLDRQPYSALVAHRPLFRGSGGFSRAASLRCRLSHRQYGPGSRAFERKSADQVGRDLSGMVDVPCHLFARGEGARNSRPEETPGSLPPR